MDSGLRLRRNDGRCRRNPPRQFIDNVKEPNRFALCSPIRRVMSTPFVPLFGPKSERRWRMRGGLSGTSPSFRRRPESMNTVVRSFTPRWSWMPDQVRHDRDGMAAGANAAATPPSVRQRRLDAADHAFGAEVELGR